MSNDYRRYGKDDEKAEKEREKEEKDDLTWEEKWRRDPLSAAVWALVLIWAGLVLLADNLDLFADVEWFSAWGLILTGAGVILLLEIAARLLMPDYRRPVGGNLIVAAVLLGLGLSNLVAAAIAWPLILIAIGVGLLLRGLIRTR